MAYSENTLKRVATFLRRSPLVKTHEMIMAERRVDVFKGSLATKAILSSAFQKTRGLPKIADAEEATALLQKLLHAGLIIRAKPVNARLLQPDLTRTWSDEAVYAWIYEGSQWMTILGGTALVILVLAFFMFPLWPTGLRYKASILINWGMYGVIGIIGFLLLLSIVRMIFYVITFIALKPGIWIFPNLWADCGVLESFVPLWAWDIAVPIKAGSKEKASNSTTASTVDTKVEHHNPHEHDKDE